MKYHRWRYARPEKGILLSFFLAFPFIMATAQVAPQIEWENTIGGNSYDNLTSMIQTTDDGYFVGGTSKSGISSDKSEASSSYDYWVLKLDSFGHIIWQNTIGGTATDRLESAIQTFDKGYLLGGYSNSGISGDKTEPVIGEEDYWVVKLDSSGNIMWQNTIGGDDEDELFSVIQTSDGGYLLGGYSYSDVSGDKTENNLGWYYTPDYWIVKLDSVGNIMWQNTIGGDDNDELYSVIQTSDGGYLLGGTSDSDFSNDKSESSKGSYDYWIVKLDSYGNKIWQNTIGGDKDDWLWSVKQTSDEGYILGGYSSSGIWADKSEANIGSNDLWTVKVDNYGNVVWQNTIGGFDGDWGYSIIENFRCRISIRWKLDFRDFRR
jgi:hypothetical protein